MKKGTAFLEYAIVVLFIVLVSISPMTNLNNTMSYKFNSSMKGTNPLETNYVGPDKTLPMIGQTPNDKNKEIKNIVIPEIPKQELDFYEMYNPEGTGPIAVIQGPKIIKTNQLVDFIDNSYSLYNNLINSTWSYSKNGQVIEKTLSPRQSIQTSFSEEGKYYLSLEVVDDKGLKGTVSFSVIVDDSQDNSNTPPIPLVRRFEKDIYHPDTGAFRYTKRDTLMLGDTQVVYSDSYDIDGSISQLIWEYQDNGVDKKVTTSASGTITINPQYSGFYDIKLTAIDNKGAKETYTYTYLVSKPGEEPVPIIESSLNRGENTNHFNGEIYAVGVTYKFYDVSTDDGMIVSNSWGDTKKRTPYVERTYNSPGTYYIELEVRDNNWNLKKTIKKVVVGYASSSKVIEFDESKTKERSQSISLPSNYYSMIGATVDTGNVDYSVNGNSVTITVNDGEVYGQETVTKTTEGIKKITQRSSTFSDTYFYEDNGYSGFLEKDGPVSKTLRSGSASGSKKVTGTNTGTKQAYYGNSKDLTKWEFQAWGNFNFPSYSYDSGGYKGELSEVSRTLISSTPLPSRKPTIRDSFTVTHTYRVSHAGTVTKPDTRTYNYSQDYKGKVSKDVLTDTYKYRVVVSYRIIPTN